MSLVKQIIHFLRRSLDPVQPLEQYLNEIKTIHFPILNYLTEQNELLLPAMLSLVIFHTTHQFKELAVIWMAVRD
jgi:hypothetical protein